LNEYTTGFSENAGKYLPHHENLNFHRVIVVVGGGGGVFVVVVPISGEKITNCGSVRHLN
jgi:hypothetical protein